MLFHRSLRTSTHTLPALLAAVLLAGAGCGLPDHSTNQPPSTPPPASRDDSGRTDVLIYGGDGVWPAEVHSLQNILYSHKATYQTVVAADVNPMSVDELAHYKTILIPGGDAETITRSLSTEAHARMRAAVQERGVDYLGFCAGAWIAIAPLPGSGGDVPYGIGVVNGPVQKQNPLALQGKEFAVVRARFPAGSERNLLWYGGPITPELPGGVVVRYPDGTPAISQLSSGKGWVVVSGLHPAVTPYILSALALSDRETIAPDFAWELLNSVIQHQPLRAF